MRSLLIILLIGATLIAQDDPEPIQRMAATERAFAAAASEVGTRDAFLTFLADDAIAIQPGVNGRSTTTVAARPRVAEQTLVKLPLGQRLLWEPYTGHVSSDGTLGWLTGAYALLNLPTRSISNQGAYFSIWRRQPNGTWRVWLDEGIYLPSTWQGAAPFRAAPDPDVGETGSPDESLEQAERAAMTGGAPWRARIAESIRYHRDGRMPIVGRADVTRAVSEIWNSVNFTVITSLTADSNDLGVALGGYDAIGPRGPEHGTFVRVWKRDTSGRWRIVFETSKQR